MKGSGKGSGFLHLRTKYCTQRGLLFDLIGRVLRALAIAVYPCKIVC